MFEKIKTYQKHPYVQQLRDMRAWGMILFGIIAIMVTWSGVKAVETNYSLQKQISSLQQQNQVQQLENNNLKLKNQYLNTDQFLELSARREFGKAAPGEMVLIVPKGVALAHTLNLQQTSTTTKPNKRPGNKPTYQRNFEAWIDFFLHRPHVDQ